MTQTLANGIGGVTLKSMDLRVKQEGKNLLEEISKTYIVTSKTNIMKTGI